MPGSQRKKQAPPGRPKQRKAHLADEANPRPPFERLVETGLRLSEIEAASELHDFLIHRASRLSGAERVLLVLDGVDGLKLAGSRLPRGESDAALLKAVTPWLEEARLTRAVSLRHGPGGVAPVAQRSCVVAPLIAQRELLGFLYCDLEGARGRFHDADRDLLAMLAAQAAVALANLRFAEGLERKVAERTAQLEQRVGELALIDGIQQGMAAEMNFQAIVDLVGDKLREVFKTGDLGINWWDAKARLLHHIYSYEHGLRLHTPPHAPEPGGIVDNFVRQPRVFVFNSQAEQLSRGVPVTPGTVRSRSILGVPLLAGERLLGNIVIEDHERDHAFGESEVRLLQTLAGSMSAALENARLFDETQRLLKVTEQRNAELAVINSIQQGMAAELNFQAIVNLVGDKLREVLHTGDIGIRWFDREAGLAHYLYEFEHGVRIEVPPNPLRPDSKHYARRHPLVANSHAEQLAQGIELVPGTDASRSLVSVPIIGSDRVLGAILTEDYAHDNAYGESEVRLLGTVAASMGVALENARLFGETQRLLKKTEQRNAELDTVNAVSRQVAAKLDLGALIELVGEQVRSVFKADLAYVALLDRSSGTIDFPYSTARRTSR